jgi:DNA-binding NarL/FixJ family response regulator
MPTDCGCPANGRAHQAEPIWVLTVDHHTAVRQGLLGSLALHDDPSYANPSASLPEVVAEATNGIEAAALGRRPRPDVILLDLQMPIMDGYRAIRPIKDLCPSCRVVALTACGDPGSRAQAGVNVFLVNVVSAESLVQAISAKASHP